MMYDDYLIILGGRHTLGQKEESILIGQVLFFLWFFKLKQRLGFLRSICPKMWEMSTKMKCQNHQEK